MPPLATDFFVIQNHQVALGKAEVELALEATTADLGASREACRAVSTALEEERVNAVGGWGAARKAEEAVERTNARAEEAYGKASACTDHKMGRVRRLPLAYIMCDS